MIRSIVRLGAVLGVVGGTFLLSPDSGLRLFSLIPVGTEPAYAIPENQILEKLFRFQFLRLLIPREPL